MTYTYYDVAGDVSGVTVAGERHNIADQTTTCVSDDLGRVTETDVVGITAPQSSTKYDLLGDVVRPPTPREIPPRPSAMTMAG